MNHQAFLLGIAEKKSAAQKIAQALSINGKVQTHKYKVITYYEVQTALGPLIVAPASGHLFTLLQNGKGWEYPVYDFFWTPLFEQSGLTSSYKARIKAHVELLNELLPRAKDIIIMTDYDQEGEVIGGVILEQLAPRTLKAKVKRLKFSTLTKSELQQAYLSLESSLNKGLYHRGLTRHYLDWLFGINLSRVLILALKAHTGKFQSLSTGRVQGPTLKFIYDREIEINSFVPTPYWKLTPYLLLQRKKVPIELMKYETLKTKKEAETLHALLKQSRPFITDLRKQSQSIPPPTPFNLSSLQATAYRLFKFSPSKTLEIAESLYLKALISYPRTDSEKYPTTLNHKSLASTLLAQPQYSQYKSFILPIRKQRPVQGKKTDPAHPAIYPTGETPKKLTTNEKKLYDLIVRRYLATLADDAKKEKLTLIIEFQVDQPHAQSTTFSFPILGRKSYDRILSPGWMALLETIHEQEFISITKGTPLKLKEVILEEKFTNPPPRYNQASLLKKMEAMNLGTKATRSEVIKTLFSRNYIAGEQITITPLGFSVIEVLNDYASRIIQPDLTRDFETLMEQVEQGKLNLETAVLQGIFTLHQILVNLHFKEDEIGKQLAFDLQMTDKKAKEFFTCPICKTGSLVLITSKSTKKRFLGCTNYSSDGTGCSATFPLPQKGRLTPLKKTCPLDGFPQIRVTLRGKKPYVYCINPECESRKQWIKTNNKQSQSDKE